MKLTFSRYFSIVFLFILLIHSHVHAQVDFKVMKNEIPVGKNLVTGEPITGVEYLFPTRIEDFYVDTVSSTMTVLLRDVTKNGMYLKNEGLIIMYDLSRKKMKWTQEITYALSHIKQKGNLLIEYISKTSYCVRIEDGKDLWNKGISIFYVDTDLGIGIGYKGNTGGSQKVMEGIDLDDGSVVWKRKISGNFGINQLYAVSDSVLLISASGLYKLNLLDGSGWDYPSRTGSTNLSLSGIGADARIALSMVSERYALQAGQDRVWNISSNIYVDSTGIYYASQENIVKLDSAGHVIWSSELPYSLTSRSDIFIKDGMVFMVNLGLARKNYNTTPLGLPFLAAFEAETGKQLYMQKSPNFSEPLIDYRIQDDTLLMLYTYRYSKYSLKDGIKISEKGYTPQSHGRFLLLVSDLIYTEKAHTMKSLSETDSSLFYILTDKYQILGVNASMEIKKYMEFGDLSLLMHNRPGLKILNNKQTSVIIDDAGNILAEIDYSGNGILKGKKLFFTTDKSITEIDLSSFFK